MNTELTCSSPPVASFAWRYLSSTWLCTKSRLASPVYQAIVRKWPSRLARQVAVSGRTGNPTENLVPFAIAVMLAHAAGVSNTMTVAGAEIFLGARLVHAVTYFLGITGIRTLAYVASVVGTVLIFIQLI